MNQKLQNLIKFQSDINQCMKCGFCSYFCPIYTEEKREGGLARGKNEIIRSVLNNGYKMSKGFYRIINDCLLCKTCVVNCPANARIDHAVIAARADFVEVKGLPPIKVFAYKFVLSNRTIFGIILRIVSWFQFILPKSEGKFSHLPNFLPAMVAGRTTPHFPSKFLRNRLPERNLPKGTPRGRVAFFSGCATEFMFPEQGVKIVEILKDLGCEVIYDKRQGCCGAPVYFSGDLKTGKNLARNNVKYLEEYDYIVTGCATCGSGLKDYSTYLADTPEEKKRFESFAAKVKDFSEFIIDILSIEPELFTLKPEFEGKRVTWHSPCHLVHHQKIREQPRKILKSLDNIRFVEMPNADQCCGMGDSYTITHYDVSKKIADRKVEGIKATEADIVATACPGCVIQIRDALCRHNSKIPVYHIAELFQIRKTK